MDLLFQFKPLVLNLKKEVAAPKNVLVLACCTLRSFVVVLHQML